MNIHAILNLNDKSTPLIEDLNFNIKDLNEIKLQSQVFSLPPYYKHLIKRTEELAQLDANGNLGNPITTTFNGMDADQLFALFLRDLQKFLNEATNITTNKADALSVQIAKILEAKKTLVSNIAAGLSILAGVADPAESRALNIASKAFEHYLDTDITDAYLANAVLQFEASQPGNNQSFKYLNFSISTDQPSYQKGAKATLSLVQQTDAYQPAITQGNFLQNNALSLSYQVEVPIPLNAPPAPPVLVKQEAVQGSPDGTQIVKELTLWDYNLSFMMPPAVQDQVIIDVKFNPSQADGLVNTAAIIKDLFSALAQYEFVANNLWKILEADNLLPPSVQYINAVKSFAHLTENIVNNWSVRSPELSPVLAIDAAAKGEIKHQFITHSNYNESGSLKSIILSGISTDDEAINWPTLHIQSTSGSFTLLKTEKLTERSVLYLIEEETSVMPVIKMSFLALPFEKASVADAQLKIIRNQELIPGITTNPAFILISDAVNTVPVSPVYVFDKPIDITKAGSNFTAGLEAFFAQLFGKASDSKLISVEVSYLQPISIDSDGNKGLMIQTPVLLLPPTSLSSAIAAELVTAAETWFATNQPPTQSAEWALALKVFDKNEPDSIILSISQLVYQLGN
ncbi:hypothetical protein HDF19_08225 [Mucilaginibacter sp. E4BP6]|uniref:hypothetical protein n=1 Tax=Mucilaginibacter sp. E4BP6 TaxID=2723089 RepID=UPI0015CD16A2|nr:hypothetical protein [Mucilaginibacter sp. E4BP6]NYE67597.1 hypothetical protein [Mucilaginibacter sp. E4BP6]